jgi:hypothetical protein
MDVITLAGSDSMMRRLVICTAVTLAVTAAPAVSKLTSHETGLRFTSQTVKIPRTLVKHQLAGVSNQGIFKFRHAAGPLAQLKPGKIMFLEGSDVLRVTKVTRKHGKLLVSTKPAGVPDLLTAGKVSFSGTPDAHQAFLSKLVEPGTTKMARDFVRPGYPYVGRPPYVARAAGTPPLTISGSEGEFGYSLGFTPVSGSRLNFDGTLCFGDGSICAVGTSNGIDMEVNFTGYIDLGNLSGGSSFNAGNFAGSTDFSVHNLNVHLHTVYAIGRGDGGTSKADPPVLHVPFGLDYTVPGEIPFYIKLQVGLLVKLGVSSHKAAIHGGFDLNFGASNNSVKAIGNKDPAASGSGDQGDGQILAQSNGGVPPSESAAASGVVVALQWPKLGFGLGVTDLNGIAYGELVNSIGQTVGSAFGGQLCSSFDWFRAFKMGMEAQIGLGKAGLTFDSPPVTIWPSNPDTPVQLADPGCKQV